MQGLGDIKAALMEIAQEQQKEEAENAAKEEILQRHHATAQSTQNLTLQR